MTCPHNVGEVRARSVLVHAGQHATRHIKGARRWVKVPGAERDQAVHPYQRTFLLHTQRGSSMDFSPT